MIRFNNTHCLVLCPSGHLIESHDLKEWGGSMFANDVAELQHGIPNRLSRLIAECDGYGHGGTRQ